MCHAVLFLAFVGILAAPMTVPAVDLEVRGRVVDQSGLPLPGATVLLTAVAGGAPRLAMTGAEGEYRFLVAPGKYRLIVELAGFTPVEQDLVVAAAHTIPDIVLSISRFAEETTVVAILETEVQPQSFAAPATLASKVIDNAPVKSNRYEDVLPLVPTVVRGPDGTISIAGARAEQGVVLLNGVPHTDPVNSEADAAVPLPAIDTLQVYATGYPAELGPASGGVTSINSRSGTDQFRFTLNAFVPRPRWGRGITQGIESWGPLLGLSGPIRKGRLWFGHALEYRFERAPAETAAGAEDRRQNGVLSLTQVDARLSSSHLLTAWVTADLDRIEGFGLNAFMPAGSMPVHRKRIWSGSFLDRLTIGLASTLETRLAVRRHRVLVGPSAAAADAYTVAHDTAQGRYFNSQDRRAHSFHLAAVVTSARTNLAGEHLFKVGLAITHTAFAGTNASQPVAYLFSSGRVARRIQFLGDPSFDARGHDVGLFVQDSWAVGSRLRLEAGLRFEAASFLPAVVTPRMGVTWQATGRTTVTGGVGLYADRMPLAALAFSTLQSRVETVFDEAGVPILPATTSANVVRGPLERPRTGTWSAEIDHTLARSWRLRLVYQERLSGRELVVRPVSQGVAVTQSVLSSQGSSRARSLEVTFGFRPPTAVHQLYVSYVRSTARGNLNDLNTIEGSLRQPFVQPDAVVRLGADVPHRLIVWGLISLPGSATFGPFLELRSGFPYSVLGDDWSYAEHPNSRRFPTFASLDIVVTKDLTLPGGIPARIGAKVFNVTGARNGRDVQRDIDRADFGRTFNAVGAQVRGFFEILWGEKRK